MSRKSRKQRRTLIWLVAALFCGAMLCTCAIGQEEPAAVELSETESAMIGELNAFRARSGLAALSPTSEIMARARSHANWMAANSSMTHSSGIRENIAFGQRTAAEVTRVWEHSSGHNANMRTSDKEVGVAHVNGMWVQQFATGSANWGRRAAEVAVTAATAPVRATANFVQNHRRGFFRRRG